MNLPGKRKFSSMTTRAILSLCVLLSFVNFTYSQNGECSNDFALETLIGTWKVDGKDAFEKWEEGADPSEFNGKGFKVTNGAEKVSELLEIKKEDGKQHLFATVRDQNEGATVRFTLTSSDCGKYVFENPDHDFPKKIIYEFLTDEKLRVKVTGENDKGFSLKMNKIKKD